MEDILIRVTEKVSDRGAFEEELPRFKQLHFLFSPVQSIKEPFPQIQAATVDAYVKKIISSSHLDSHNIDDFLFGVDSTEIEASLERVSLVAHDQLAMERLRERFEELYGVHAVGYPHYKCNLPPAEPASGDPSTLVKQLVALVNGGYLASLTPSDIISHSGAVCQLLLVRKKLVSWILLELITPKAADMRERALLRWYSVALKLRGTNVYGCVREALSHPALTQIRVTKLPPLPACSLGESFTETLLDLTKYDVLAPDTMGERNLRNFRKTCAIGRISHTFYRTINRASADSPLDLSSLPPMLTDNELFFLASATLGRHPLSQKPSVVSKLFGFLASRSVEEVTFSPSELFTVDVDVVFEDSQGGFKYQRGAPIVAANSVNNFLWIVEEGEVGVCNPQRELVGRPLLRGNVFGCLSLYHLSQSERTTEFPVVALSSIASLRRVERSRVFHTFRHDPSAACKFYKSTLEAIASRAFGFPTATRIKSKHENIDLFPLFDGVVAADEKASASFPAKYAVSETLTLYGVLYITEAHACFVSFTFMSRFRFAVALGVLGKFGEFSDTSSSIVLGHHRIEFITDSDTELAEVALVEALRGSISSLAGDTSALQSDTVIVDHEWHLLIRSTRETRLDADQLLLQKGCYATHMYCVVGGSIVGEDDSTPLDGLFGAQLFYSATTSPCDIRAGPEGAIVLQVSLAHMDLIAAAKPAFGARLFEWISSQLFQLLAISTRSALDSVVSSKMKTQI